MNSHKVYAKLQSGAWKPFIEASNHKSTVEWVVSAACGDRNGLIEILMNYDN